VRFTVPPGLPLPAGSYRVLLRINGQQAASSPELVWS
jgi:hypothetical protein